MQKFKLVFLKSSFSTKPSVNRRNSQVPFDERGLHPTKGTAVPSASYRILKSIVISSQGGLLLPVIENVIISLRFKADYQRTTESHPEKVSLKRTDSVNGVCVCVCVCGFPGQKLIASCARLAGIECQKVSWSCIGMGSAVCELKLMEQLVFLKFNWSSP